MINLYVDAVAATADDLFATHTDLGPGSGQDTLDMVLFRSLANRDPQSRATIVARMLEWGADATTIQQGITTLHVLLGNLDDLAVDVRVLGWLLDRGADMNAKGGKFGRPFETLFTKIKYTDEQLDPLYHEFLKRPGLDLTSVNSNGNTVIDVARNAIRWRASLIPRLERYLAEGPETP
jgi:hypothetical protein